LARRVVERLRKIEGSRPLYAEVVVRPAELWQQPGWGWSLYALGFGPSAADARAAWAEAALTVAIAAHHVLCNVGE
jgi:hypothetical protein